MRCYCRALADRHLRRRCQPLQGVCMREGGLRRCAVADSSRRVADHIARDLGDGLSRDGRNWEQVHRIQARVEHSEDSISGSVSAMAGPFLKSVCMPQELTPPTSQQRAVTQTTPSGTHSSSSTGPLPMFAVSYVVGAKSCTSVLFRPAFCLISARSAPRSLRSPRMPRMRTMSTATDKRDWGQQDEQVEE